MMIKHARIRFASALASKNHLRRRGHREPLLCLFLSLFLVVTAGCDSLNPTATNSNNNSSGTGNGAPPSPGIIIGSFNIQSFGRTKLGKPEVMRVLVDIAHRFDVLAIQELRDKDQRVIPEFLRLINQNGFNYKASVGPRQGYYVQKDQRTYEEQMVYIYDANRVEQIGQTYVLPDHSRKMHRPPYVAKFRCNNVPAQEAFSFVLMNVHVDYDDAVAEFGMMETIIRPVFTNHPEEDDFILLGDLNGEPATFQRFRWMPNQYACIPNHWKTNTRQSEAYDNIVIDSQNTAEFTNQCGVLNLMTEYSLSYDDAKQVSDHMPVWAVFSPREAIASSAAQNRGAMR